MEAVLKQCESVSDAQNGPQVRPPDEDLRGVRVAVHLAQEMGARLGGGEVLLGPVPGEGGASGLGPLSGFIGDKEK